MPNTFKSFQSIAVTAESTVYTGPASAQSTVIGMSVANTQNSPAYVSIKLNNAHIVKNAPIPVGGSLVAIGGDQKLVVEAGDTVSVSSDTLVDVVLSVLEIT